MDKRINPKFAGKAEQPAPAPKVGSRKAAAVKAASGKK